MQDSVSKEANVCELSCCARLVAFFAEVGRSEHGSILRPLSLHEKLPSGPCNLFKRRPAVPDRANVVLCVDPKHTCKRQSQRRTNYEDLEYSLQKEVYLERDFPDGYSWDVYCIVASQ